MTKQKSYNGWGWEQKAVHYYAAHTKIFGWDQNKQNTNKHDNPVPDFTYAIAAINTFSFTSLSSYIVAIEMIAY